MDEPTDVAAGPGPGPTRPAGPRRRPARPARQLDLLRRPDGRTAILMASGFVFDLAAPDATGMPIEDIAQALSSQPRWGGATRPWYSVAEHCVLASRIVPERYARDALLHDSEEFLGDIVSPLKLLIGREHLGRIVGPVKRALAREFRFRPDLATVKRADLVCMATELRDLLPTHWMDWGHLPPPAPARIVPVGPEKAFDAFMGRYRELTR